MVGGKPTRSKVTRRSQVSLSEPSKGTIPSLRSCSRRKSIGFLPSGTAGSDSARRDQSSAVDVTVLAACVANKPQSSNAIPMNDCPLSMFLRFDNWTAREQYTERLPDTLLILL